MFDYMTLEGEALSDEHNPCYLTAPGVATALNTCTTEHQKMDKIC